MKNNNTNLSTVTTVCDVESTLSDIINDETVYTINDSANLSYTLDNLVNCYGDEDTCTFVFGNGQTIAIVYGYTNDYQGLLDKIADEDCERSLQGKSERLEGCKVYDEDLAEYDENSVTRLGNYSDTYAYDISNLSFYTVPVSSLPRTTVSVTLEATCNLIIDGDTDNTGDDKVITVVLELTADETLDNILSMWYTPHIEEAIEKTFESTDPNPYVYVKAHRILAVAVGDKTITVS